MKSAPRYRFRLYVAGDAENSLAAIGNLRGVCERFLPGNHDVELVDVLVEPMRALADGVLLTPMLIKIAPPPLRRVIGSLSDVTKLLAAIDLPAVAA